MQDHGYHAFDDHVFKRPVSRLVDEGDQGIRDLASVFLIVVEISTISSGQDAGVKLTVHWLLYLSDMCPDNSGTE